MGHDDHLSARHVLDKESRMSFSGSLAKRRSYFAPSAPNSISFSKNEVSHFLPESPVLKEGLQVTQANHLREIITRSELKTDLSAGSFKAPFNAIRFSDL
jgi:hypothetical protein